MKQETMNRTHRNTFNASFQQKSTGLSLVITSSAAAYFMARAWVIRPAVQASDTTPVGYGTLVITTLILLIVAQVVLQTVLAVGAGSAEPATAVEQMAALKARRNAYFVLTAAVLAAAGSVFVEVFTPFDTVNVIVVGLALAEIVQAASQLFYAQR